MSACYDGKHGGWVAGYATPKRPWLVHVKRRGRIFGPTSWLVWCPCCSRWEDFDSFGDAMGAVVDILPGAVKR